MRALFVSNDASTFDEASASRARMREYAAAIGELHVVSAGPRGAKALQEGPLFLHPVAPGFFRLFRLMRTASRVARDRAVDVVSAQDPFEHGFIARRAVRGTKARLHIQVHTDLASTHFAEGSMKNRIRLMLADRVLPEADGIRTVSKRVRDGLVTRYGERIADPSVLPIAPAPVADPPVALPPLPFSFTLLSVGRLEPEKRLEDAMEALSIVRKKYPGTGLVVVGSGREESRLRAKAKSAGLDGAVAFLGARTDANGLMRTANAFIQASAYEGYGRTLVEAAVARVPIVTTEVGIVGDVLVPEREVLACAPGDIPGLAAQVTRLIEDNQLRRALTVNAEAAVLAHLGHYQNLAGLVAEDLMRHAAPARNPDAS